MPRFEVNIPAADPADLNVTLRVDAETWMAALRTGLHKLGEQGSSVQNVLVDIQGDGSVHVTESHTGRVFEIRKITEGAGKPTVGAEPVPIPLAKFASEQAARPGTPVESAPGGEDQHPTLLDLPAAPSMPGRAPPAPPRAPAVPAAEARPAAGQNASPRRDSTGWAWDARLDPRGDLEAAPPRPDASRRAGPAPRTPAAGVKRLQPAAVVELERPTLSKGQIGRALDKRFPREEIEDSLSEVFERVQGIYAQASEQNALYLLLDLALEKIQAESGSVLMSNAWTGDLAFAAARGPKAAELLQAKFIVPPGVGLAGFCAAEGVSVALSDVERDPRWHSEVSERLKYQTKSVLCAPMMTHGRSFGCMQLINRKGSDAFTEHEIGMLAYIAHQGALYLNSQT